MILIEKYNHPSVQCYSALAHHQTFHQQAIKWQSKWRRGVLLPSSLKLLLDCSGTEQQEYNIVQEGHKSTSEFATPPLAAPTPVGLLHFE